MRQDKRLFHSDDLIVGQPCIVMHMTFDGVTVREHGKLGKFQGRDAGGHAMVDYDDGTAEVLLDDKRLRG